MGFLEDSRGSLWVATDGGGLDKFDRATGKFVHYSSQTSNLKLANLGRRVKCNKCGRQFDADWGDVA